MRRNDMRTADDRNRIETSGAAGVEPEAAEPEPVELQRLRLLPFTDSGNAERLEILHGADLRHVAAESKWYAWTNVRWKPDDGRALLATKDVARRLYALAGETKDDSIRQSMASWARQSESSGKRTAMLTLAKAEGRIPATPADFDADPWLFNCANGTIDLRTGELRQHQCLDFITKLSPVHYDPAARSESWEQFLDSLTDGDGDFREFLQKAAGYSLTGDCGEEKLFLVLGEAATGKSTFVESLRAVWGDYARTADFESFVQRRDAGVRNDLAALAGRRLVVSVEVEKGRQLAEGLLKTFTGRDTVTARFLYGEHFEFRPQCKLWLVANDPPGVRHDDGGMWRRILRLPFENVIPKGGRDPTLKARLTSDSREQAAILAWAVKGCLRWQKAGLQEPARVVRATEAYKQEQNPLRDFVEERCELGEGCKATPAKLRAAYERWCEEQGGRSLGRKNYGSALRALGCESTKLSNDTRWWLGISLREGAE